MESGSGTDVTVLVVSIAIIPAVFVVVLLCIKIRVSRSNPDIYGVEGTVTRKCEDQLNISNGSSKLLAPPTNEESSNRTPSYDRKLPELPEDIYRTGSTKDDNTSELYATVDDDIARNLRPEGATALPDVDTSHHPYARVKKQGKQEHSYAKVGEGQSGSKTIEDDDDDTEYETTEKLDPPPPHIPPPHPPTQQQQQQDINSAFPPPPPPPGGAQGGPLPQAGPSGAVAGGSIGFPPTGPAANAGSFVPWVPPPPRNAASRQSTPLPPEPNHNQGAQQHFSGDSQESTYSTKGYTSISVREPLENLRPQVNHQPQPAIQEGNYVTLSETSDEMYAAIEDTVYMDPMGSAHAANRTQQRRAEEDPNIMYSKIDKSKKRSERPTASYDNGYATVNKVKGRSGKKEKLDPGYETVPYSSPKLSDNAASSSSRSGGVAGPSGGSCGASAGGSSRAAGSKDPEYEVLPGESKDGKNIDGRDPDYETVPSGSQSREPGYETLPPRFRADSFDPGYETLSKRPVGAGPRSYPQYSNHSFREYREPGYETVSDLRSHHNHPPDPDYESVANGGGGGNSANNIVMGSSPPGTGYESAGGEPGYETVPDSKARSLPSTNHGDDPPQSAIRHHSGLSAGYAECSSPSGLRPASRTSSPASAGGVPRSAGSPGDLRLGVGALGGARPRAAPAMQTPPPPHHRIMGGVSEPELHSNSGLVDTNIEYQSIRNYPSTSQNNNNIKHYKDEEGYETIPDIAAKPHSGMTTSSGETSNYRYVQLASPEEGDSWMGEGGVKRGSAATGGGRAAPVPPLPEPGGGGRNIRTRLSPSGCDEVEGGVDPGYEFIRSRQEEGEGQSTKDLNAAGEQPATLTKSRFDNEEITYIDEESSSAPLTPGSPVSSPLGASSGMGEGAGGPLPLRSSGDGGPLPPRSPLTALHNNVSGSSPPLSLGSNTSSHNNTPGSPTIHMSVVNTGGAGVRRASVVMIERVDDEKESLTSFDNHVFV